MHLTWADLRAVLAGPATLAALLGSGTARISGDPALVRAALDGFDVPGFRAD